MRVVLALLAACAGCQAPEIGFGRYAATPGTNVQFIKFAPQKSATDPGTWGAVLLDIERHLPASYGTQYQDSDKITHGHETTHGINSHVRNTLSPSGVKSNGFYLLQDRAVVVPEPKMSKSKIAQYVPAALRQSRFSTYVTGQTAWDDRPLYVFDEWVAYTNGGSVGVDLVKSGKWTYPWRDGVAGQVEFVVYAIATVMAIEQHDPAYLPANPQFKEFFAFEVRRSMDVFRQGYKLKEFAYATFDAYYQKLQAGPEAQPLRDFLTKLYGKAYTDEVLLGTVGPPPGPDGGPGLQPDGALPPPGSDHQAPQVAILSPPALSTVPPAITVRAQIVDNVGVARAALHVDGTLVASLTQAPYDFPIQLQVGQHELRVVAYDAAGNQGQAAVLVIVSAGAPEPPVAPPTTPPATPPTKGGFGAPCSGPQDCATGLCVADSKFTLRYCTEPCTPGVSVCPAQTTCTKAGAQSVCAAASVQSPPTGGGCAVAGHVAGAPFALWLGLLAWLLCRRRER